MPAPPFMHGAAHWMAFNALGGGNTLVLPPRTQTLDPALRLVHHRGRRGQHPAHRG